MEGLEWGNRGHNIRARNRPRAGAVKNGYVFARVGDDNSFVNNFIASARGCGRPIKPTLLGPFRV